MRLLFRREFQHSCDLGRRILDVRPSHVLDVACGTGDFAIALSQAGVEKITGVDISQGMLDVGIAKVKALGLNIEMHVDDCEQLSIEDDTFDAVSVAFGVRNFEHLQQGLNEMQRVLRPGGLVCIVELSVPSNALLRWAYKLYFLHILQFVGGLVSGNRNAYRYLPESIAAVPQGHDMLAIMRQAGFNDCKVKRLTFGTCSIYTGNA